MDEAASATKQLSLKLLEARTPQQVMRVFEEEVIHAEEQKIYGPELVMVLKFLQHTLSQDM